MVVTPPRATPLLLDRTYTLGMSPRDLPWSRALRAGSVAFLTSTLVIALLLGTYWAAHTNFPGHHHPPGTAVHTHSLIQALGAPSVPAAVVVAIPTFFALLDPRLKNVVWPSLRSLCTVLARAPPRAVRPGRLSGAELHQRLHMVREPHWTPSDTAHAYA